MDLYPREGCGGGGGGGRGGVPEEPLPGNRQSKNWYHILEVKLTDPDKDQTPLLPTLRKSPFGQNTLALF